jgi:hypothetical protein
MSTLIQKGSKIIIYVLLHGMNEREPLTFFFFFFFFFYYQISNLIDKKDQKVNIEGQYIPYE